MATYRIGVSFGDDPVFTAENSYYTATVGSMEGYIKWTHLYALRDADGAVAREDFIELVQSVYVESFDATSGNLCDPVTALVCENKERPVAMLAPIYFDSNSGKRDLVWHVQLKSGKELVFRQTMEIFQKEHLVFTYEDTPMSTMEEQRALIREIEDTTTENTSVWIYLPAVTYEGQLELKRGYFIFGSQSESGVTTFTDTVTCSAPYPQIMRFTDIVFEGNGSGTGLLDLCGTELYQCSLRNWDIAAMTGETGWILSFGSSFMNNGTPIEFNCTQSWYNISEYPDNVFIDNENAVVINQIMPIATLTFENSVFHGNKNTIVNYTQQGVDLSGAVVK